MMIRTKLTLSITLLISIAIAVISSIIGYKVHKIAEYNAQIIAKETAHHYAKYVRAELEIPLDEARAVANLFETASHIKSLQITRAKIKLWLKHFIEDEPNFLGIGIVCEPDAFFEKDANFINASNKTGRFISYWTRNHKGEGVLETLLNNESQNFYQIPKQKFKESVVDPYPYSIRGKEVWLTTLVAPMIHNPTKSFLGVIRIDIALDYLQRKLGNLNI
jgi:methyl-accepting chemotaxis protein